MRTQSAIGHLNNNNYNNNNRENNSYVNKRQSFYFMQQKPHHFESHSFTSPTWCKFLIKFQEFSRNFPKNFK